ncbi:MAG: alpha-glucosidase/alpha-galactosidase [Candidatus Caldarchaeum sp.]|nr:alpha-glucosidase/alpha-galactosidase [Candidatus Caldarchaeum sp.]
MRPTVISVIGAGSVVFTGRLVVDLCLTEGLHGSVVYLMDIDRERLETMHRLATRYSDEMKADIEFRKTMDRREALENAEFVINTVKVGGYDPMEEERKIAEKHGYYRGVGERVCDYYGGVGAYYQLKFFLELARDMERYCADAWLLQAANPVFEGTNLIYRETEVKVVGICHGHLALKELTRALKMDEKDVRAVMAGFNHNIWLKEFLYKGRNAYPLIDEWIEKEAPNYWKSDEYLNNPPWITEQLSPAAVEMYRLFGLFPIGDTVRSASPWWFHEDLETKKRWLGPMGGFDSEIGWSYYLDFLRQVLDILKQLANTPSVKLSEFYRPEFSGEQHIPLINAIVNDQQTILQLNIPNNGVISGLPDDVVVEVPAVADGTGVKGIHVGSLPKRIMLFNMIPRMLKMEQILQAFLEGDKKSLILMTAEDHRTKSFQQAVDVIEEMLGMPWNEEARGHYR